MLNGRKVSGTRSGDGAAGESTAHCCCPLSHSWVGGRRLKVAAGAVQHPKPSTSPLPRVQRWIGNATWADVAIIWARNSETNQVNAFIVRKGNPGYRWALGTLE